MAKQQVKNKTGKLCVLVLGMHRSGTSALTGILSQLGATPPKTSNPPDRFNATGQFESPRLFGLSDEMLAALGSHWKDWRPRPPIRADLAELAGFAERIDAGLDAEFGEAALLLLKDPRLCLLSEVWRAALDRRGAEVRAICTTRHPDEVAASLHERDELDPLAARLLWLRYTLEAEAATRDVPRYFTSYDRLLQDWRGTVEAAGRALGVDWPRSPEMAAEAVEALLSSKLRHHRAEATEIVDMVDRAYAILALWAEAGENPNDRAELDRIGESFAAAAPLLARLLDDRDRAQAARIEAEAAASAWEAEAAGAMQREAARKAEAERLAADLAERREAADRLAAALAERQEVAEKLTADLADSRAEAARLARELDTSRQAQALAELAYRQTLASTSWRLTAPLRGLKRALTGERPHEDG